MNLGLVIYILGLVCIFEAGFMLLPLICGLIFHETHLVMVYIFCIGLNLAVGSLMAAFGKRDGIMHPKEGMIIVGLSWVVMSLLGALPFFLSREIPGYIDAFFETVSGFTTTGSTILTDLDAMSYANRFWRSFTHWIGGMGVLVFLLALLPARGGGFMALMQAESPGPEVSKLVPKVQDTAKTLYRIYIGLTVMELILLLFAGMEFFDAITLTMGTAGTGGFAVRSSGFSTYSMLQCAIIAVFMMLFGINFNFYFLLLRRKWKQATHMEEVWSYLGIIAFVTIIITLTVLPGFGSAFEAFHHVYFTVSSLITTTGYATVDFSLWPTIATVLLVMIMFVGACAGSTGGGIKVSRFNIMIKGIVKEFETLIHPRSIRKVRMDGKVIPHEVVRSTNVFIAIYILVFAASIFLIALDGKDLTTSFTSVAATLNNIGPGLGEVGPMGSFADFSGFAKLVFCFDMLAGRLELLPMLLIFIPSMWLSLPSGLRDTEEERKSFWKKSRKADVSKNRSL